MRMHNGPAVLQKSGAGWPELGPAAGCITYRPVYIYGLWHFYVIKILPPQEASILQRGVDWLLTKLVGTMISPVYQLQPCAFGKVGRVAYNKEARYRRQFAMQKYNSKKRASNIALSYGVEVDK